MNNLVVFGAGSGDDIVHFKENVVPGQSDWAIYAFEPGPKRYDDLAWRFSKVDSIKCIHAAVGNYDGIVKLYDGKGPNNRSIDPGKVGLKEEMFDAVTIVDVRRWFKENLKPDDQNIVVIDIEGAEYDVVDALVQSDLISWIDELYIEFHGKKLKGFDMNRELQMVDDLKEIFNDKVYIYEYYQHDKFLMMNNEGTPINEKV